MAKKVVAKVKLVVKGGQATPAPPVGPALGQHQINIGEFIKKFNDATRKHMGIPLSVVLKVFEDKKYDMIIKGPTTSYLLKKAADIAKGSSVPNLDKVAAIKKSQVLEIAEQKKEFLNAHDVEQAMRIVEGTARSMGIEVVEG